MEPRALLLANWCAAPSGAGIGLDPGRHRGHRVLLNRALDDDHQLLVPANATIQRGLAAAAVHHADAMDDARARVALQQSAADGRNQRRAFDQLEHRFIGGAHRGELCGCAGFLGDLGGRCAEALDRW
jgi:hypothetical protein